MKEKKAVEKRDHLHLEGTGNLETLFNCWKNTKL